jgi:hypothetical protein
MKLEAKFLHRYNPSTPVFYVSICNEFGKECSVSDEEKAHWGPH